MKEFDWSEWYPLSREFLSYLPDTPGVYEIRTDYEFGRLKGVSRTVYVGSAARGSKPSLKRRLGQRNPSGEEKLLIRTGHSLEFRFTKARDSNTAREMEIQRIRHYEEKHWEAPPGVHKIFG